MVRRGTTLLFLLLMMTVGGTGVALAATSAPHSTAVRSAPMQSVDGIDPAERDAVNGTLGYHEKRGYPYGLLVSLIVVTPLALVLIRRWAPQMEDESA